MNAVAVPWAAVAVRLRPFVARRVSPADVDDVMQDVLVRIHKHVADIRDEDRFVTWMFQIARNAIADHGRTRARYPVPASELVVEQFCDNNANNTDVDRAAVGELAGCVSMFVAQLSPPYRQAITLVELESLTAREAAEMVGISVSGMKSRVQRGRAQLREMFEQCCAIDLDARGKVTDFTPRQQRTCTPGA